MILLATGPYWVQTSPPARKAAHCPYKPFTIKHVKRELLLTQTLPGWQYYGYMMTAKRGPWLLGQDHVVLHDEVHDHGDQGDCLPWPLPLFQPGVSSPSPCHHSQPGTSPHAQGTPLGNIQYPLAGGFCWQSSATMYHLEHTDIRTFPPCWVCSWRTQYNLSSWCASQQTGVPCES